MTVGQRETEDLSSVAQAEVDAHAAQTALRRQRQERYGLSPEQAFDALARISIASNRELRAIAEVVARTGELTDVPRPSHRTPT